MKLFYKIAIFMIEFELWCIRGQILRGHPQVQARIFQARILVLRERRTLYQTALQTLGA
jgi:hypothetical protein